MDVSSASECSDNDSDDSDSRDIGGYRCQNCFVTGKYGPLQAYHIYVDKKYMFFFFLDLSYKRIPIT